MSRAGNRQAGGELDHQIVPFWESPRRPARLVLVCLVLGLLTAALPARAETAAVVIASRSAYMPGDTRNVVPVVLVHGNDLLFLNADAFSFGGHSLTSAEPGLFDSGVVEIRDSATIPMSAIAPGTYDFYCTVHLEMKGQLVIV